MKKVLFIDRDGTMTLEPSDYQVDSFEKLVFYPSIFQYLGKIARELDYELVLVTNQDGLGTDSFPEEAFWPYQNHLVKTFANEGIVFSEIFIDRTFPEEQAVTRKPGTGMLTAYLNNRNYDLSSSFVIGDRLTDMELAKNLGAQGIFIDNNADLGAD
jgi:imidazoleglycerol-phosphate dehydratase/histidinol-phosphatase